MNVGFIGLGRMGQGMARRILSGGHNLTVHDAVISQVSDIVSAGAIAAATIADACKDREVVVTMLVEDAVVVELKTVQGLLPVHKAQLLSYLKLGRFKLGYLLNFQVAHMREGVIRMVNGL